MGLDGAAGRVLHMRLLGKLVFAVLGALFGGMLIFCLSLLAESATLSISGSAVGNGSHLFQVVGDNLTAWWNGTAWNVTGAM